MATLQLGKGKADGSNRLYKPLFFRLDNIEDEKQFNELLNNDCLVRDEIMLQVRELIKVRNVSRRIKDEEYADLITQHLAGRNADHYGVWVYYPWTRTMVHLLDEAEFVEVRTSRNKYKITEAEQETLRRKKVGILGLSVGQSIAVTMAIERACGELRLADFDEIELSNLNRIRTGVHNLGINKSVIAAREIAEIDPYLDVRIYENGLTDDNMDAFFTEGGILDILIEECDSLDMKVASRIKARSLGIPVIMDTSDRGMIDVERFDLQPERPLLHGLVGDLDVSQLKNLTPEERIVLVLQIAGSEKVSVRGKASLVEVGQSIGTWPQLASSVVMGGGVTTDTVRRILLKQFNESGRYYMDPEDIIKDRKQPAADPYPNPYAPLTESERLAMMEKVLPGLAAETRDELPDAVIKKIIDAAVAAPTTGNDQPWLWDYKDGVLFLFHDRIRSYSFGDYKSVASYLSFGAAIENLSLAARKEGFNLTVKDFTPQDEPLIALAYFTKSAESEHPYPQLSEQIFTRHTNRTIIPRQEPDMQVLQEIRNITETVPGAELRWLTDIEDIKKIGGIIGACDRMRILNPRGHADFVQREMRWTVQDAEERRDGIDVRTLGLSPGQMTALSVIKETDVIDVLRDVKGGGLFEMATRMSVGTAAAIGLITMPGNGMNDYLAGGRAMERMWLAAEAMGWAIHPVISPVYLFSRITLGDGESLSDEEITTLHKLRKEFLALCNTEARGEMFLFKLFKAEKRPEILSMRRLVDNVLTIH
ncbi:Rv1355c family protein [Chitinophagaceae bacterium MMS25-I14]